jgi:hypothetical protein
VISVQCLRVISLQDMLCPSLNRKLEGVTTGSESRPFRQVLTVDVKLAADENRCEPLGPCGSNAFRMVVGLPTNLWRADVRRWEFIAGLAGAAAWSVITRAQQPDRVRPIGEQT